MTTESSRTNTERVLAQLARSDAIGSGALQSAFAEISEAAAKTLDVRRVNIWLFDDTQSKIERVEHFDLELGTHSQGGELLARDYPKYFDAPTEWSDESLSSLENYAHGRTPKT